MPIRDPEFSEQAACPCCGKATAVSAGLADTPRERGIPYVVRWTPDASEDGAAFLVCFGEGEATRAVASFYHLEADGFRVMDPDDYDWHGLPDCGRILTRAEVLGTPLAEAAFRVLDEIWLHDPYLGLHLCCNTVAFDQAGDPSAEELERQALEAQGPREVERSVSGVVGWMDRCLPWLRFPR